MNRHFSNSIADLVPQDQIERALAVATRPYTLEEKLKKFDELKVEKAQWNPRANNGKGRMEKRSVLGTLANQIFNKFEGLTLPNINRRQQIGNAIRFGRQFLIDNPEVSVYYALLQGAAQEAREWNMCVGNLSEEQQISMLSNEQPTQAQIEEKE